jgi:hypothetical protein
MKTPDEAPRARRHMSPAGQVVIPILLVMLLIAIIGRQILLSGLENEEAPPAPPPATRDPEKDKESSGPSRVATAYPRACMRDESPDGSGLIAAAHGDSVGVGTPEGQPAFGLRAASPVGFSASGAYLATAGADLWSRTGAHLGLAFGQPAVTWAWSPAADCLVGIERGRLMFVRPDKPPEVLVRGVPVSDLAFSPDGSRLIFAVAEGSSASGIWLADLRSGEVKLLLDEIGWEVTAWSRAMRPIMLQEEAGARSRDGLSFGPADEVAYCGSEVITVQEGRLATFGVRDVPSFLSADRRFSYTAVGCSPDDEQLIVVRHPKGNASLTSLAVLGLDGSLVREFADDTATEDLPMWGPSGTGVVFAASPRGGEPLVWFLPEGGEPRQTGLRVARLGDGLDALLDWSATPPVGHPTS